MIVHVGEAGERAVAPFRELAEPMADMLREMPYPGIYMEEGDFHPIASTGRCSSIASTRTSPPRC